MHRLLDHLPPGDVVVVWKLDRLSRSLKDLLQDEHRTGFADDELSCDEMLYEV